MTTGRLEATPVRPSRAPRTARPGYVVLAGLAWLLVAWILVIPPFGGSDEFDHAYRAASAARGEWFITPTDATRGTGAWLDVPRDIVDAARPQCQTLPYTKDADCVGTVHGDTVRIASGAGRYHPLFYAIVGTIALPFNGDAALYAMRLATLLLSVGLMALALVATRTWARSRLAQLGPIVACTPVVAYSCAIVAPNGPEMLAALGFWAAAIGLWVADDRHVRRLAVVAAVSGATLCTLRPLGPLWCLLAAGVVVVAVRPRPGQVRALVRRRDVQVAAGVVTLSAIQGTAWTLAMGSLKVGGVSSGHTSVGHRVGEVLPMVPVWVLQSIAAFPLRNNATSPVVYPCYLLVFGAVLVVALRYADRRMRLAVVALVLMCLAFPFVTTVSSYDTFGAAWQGRYGLPLAIGLVVLGAYALDRVRESVPWVWLITGGALFVVAQAVGVGYTLHLEASQSPLADSSAWVQPPMWLAVGLAAIGAVLMWSAVLARPEKQVAHD